MRRFLPLLLSIIFSSNLIAQKQTGVQDATNARANPYFSVQRITVKGGISVDRIIINGPPKPPPGIARTTSALPEPHQTAAINTLIEVPAFDWSFGCSATSAAMIAGYYDRHGYGNMYAGPTNDGVMPLDNSSWPYWEDSNHDMLAQCPLSATHNGLDGRIIRGHVDDYWIAYGQEGPDPFVTNSWTEHTLGECTADFMKTNKWISDVDGFNIDGGTTFYSYNNNTPLTAAAMEAYGIHVKDGGYGIKLFYESRGYTVVNMYNQRIYGYNGISAGFTFAQYKAEIDAGRPVMFHVEGHTMVGLGYNDATNLMYIHDTWDYSTHTMTWGGSYSGMLHWGVTIVQLAEAEIDIQGNSNSIPDGDTTPSATDGTDFGTVNVGDEVTHVFTIYNTGDYDLYLTGSPLVQISGSTDFTVISQPSGDPVTFSVLYSPSATSPQTATITVPNTDLNENPYDFFLQGNGGDQYVIASVTAFLEGPYQAGGSMTTALAGSIPEISPYADARTVSEVPAGVTDWVSVELRSTAGGSPVAQKSFFLKSNGSIVDVDGAATDLPIPGVAAGSYFILVSHRNHLAVMSKTAQSLGTGSPTTYNFSTGTGQYYGDDAKLLESGKYGMYAGDTDGLGTVDASDRSATWNGRNQNGYLDADCNLSGTVDASDRSITWNNRNKITSVP